MFRRRFRAPVLFLALLLGTFSSLSARSLQVQGHLGDARIPIHREVSGRQILQGVMDLFRALVAPGSFPPGRQPGNGLGPNETQHEGAGLCPSGRPRGLQPGN